MLIFIFENQNIRTNFGFVSKYNPYLKNKNINYLSILYLNIRM